ncbi:MAG TPA: GNAT family N-acetyltransferase [Niabella sp.]
MNTLIIRTYREKDLDNITALTNQLGYPTTADEMRQRMQLLSEDENYKTIVAAINDEAVGYAGLVKGLYWEKNGCFVRIQALVVNHQYRNRRIGKQLIDAAEQWGKEIHAKALLLNCGIKPEREGAHLFYPRMGFAATSKGYYKPVTEPLSL